MPLPVIANVYRCAINWSLGSRPNVAENVIHVLTTTRTPGQIALDLDASVNLGGNFNFDAITDQLHADSVDITPLDGSGASSVEPLTHWVGVNASDGVPATAAIVRMRTALRGRSYRGRMFLPYVAEAQQSLGFIPNVVIATMTAGWNDFWPAMSAAGSEVVVASYLHSTAEAVTSMVTQSKLGTQRRRQEQR